MTEEILCEIERVLHYPHIVRLHGWDEAQLAQYIKILSRKSSIVKPNFRLNISKDETDNRYIECAVVSDAKFLITGDKKHLLPIKEFSGIKFITPAAFILLMESANGYQEI